MARRHGKGERGPCIQELTYHLCWRLDNSKATYTLGGVGGGWVSVSFGVRTGWDKAPSGARACPGGMMGED